MLASVASLLSCGRFGYDNLELESTDEGVGKSGNGTDAAGR